MLDPILPPPPPRKLPSGRGTADELQQQPGAGAAATRPTTPRGGGGQAAAPGGLSPRPPPNRVDSGLSPRGGTAAATAAAAGVPHRPAAPPPISPPADAVAIQRAREEARALLEVLNAADPQWPIYGTANAWVAKPASQSRGRGITVSGQLSKLLATVGYASPMSAAHKRQRNGGGGGSSGGGGGADVNAAAPTTDWVIQKYVEQTALLDGRKWDLRMYAVATGWGPTLCVWFYLDGYLRCVAQDRILEPRTKVRTDP
eukprot:SAG22_NODE_18_length_32591_cov_38.043549_7_plen_258_part_00